MAATDGLSKMYGILQSETVKHYAELLKKRRTREDASIHDIKKTDIERRDALIRWQLINELLAAPRLDLLSYHSTLGSQPDFVLDLDGNGTDSRMI